MLQFAVANFVGFITSRETEINENVNMTTVKHIPKMCNYYVAEQLRLFYGLKKPENSRAPRDVAQEVELSSGSRRVAGSIPPWACRSVPEQDT